MAYLDLLSYREWGSVMKNRLQQSVNEAWGELNPKILSEHW